MNQIDFKAVNEQIEALENKRVKFRIIGICCGVTAIFPIILFPLGGLFPIAWIACLTSGFVCRSVAVKARNEAMRLRLSISNLAPNAASTAPAGDTSPSLPKLASLTTMPAAAEASKPAAQKPGAPSAKPRTTASRLDKARRREE